MKFSSLNKDKFSNKKKKGKHNLGTLASDVATNRETAKSAVSLANASFALEGRKTLNKQKANNKRRKFLISRLPSVKLLWPMDFWLIVFLCFRLAGARRDNGREKDFQFLSAKSEFNAWLCKHFFALAFVQLEDFLFRLFYNFN